MREFYASNLSRHLERHRRFFHRASAHGTGNPRFNFFVGQHPAFLVKHDQLPDAYRRKPKFVPVGLKFFCKAERKAFGFEHRPQPNVRIEKQIAQRNTSQSSESLAGETISPTIRAEPFIDPNQLFGLSGMGGGTISATGVPKRVTRIGFPVLRTRSSTAKHVALNLEIDISCTGTVYYGQ
jgi:hypothetical protein